MLPYKLAHLTGRQSLHRPPLVPSFGEKKDMAQQQKIRRYEFDWLRVLAFSLLIFYHTGMFFVSWEWHVKNNELSKVMEWPMLFLGQWRMSLLFLISGVGVYFAMGYRSTAVFAKDRLKRILLPLLFGMLVIVPPQVYLERLTQGYTYSFISFYPSVLELQSYPEGNFSWHHLWYLAYIFCYSLLLLPLLRYLRQHKPDLGRMSAWMIILLPALWLGGGEMLLRPHFPATNALTNDWANHFLYLSIFLLGFLIVTSPPLQDSIRRLRWHSLALAVVLISILYAIYWVPARELAGYEEPLYWLLKSGNRWCWILAITGFAMQHLNRRSVHLSTANEMVYPFYILHQTVIVALGFVVMDLNWPIWLKFSLMVVATFLICFVLIRGVIMQINLLRVPFGLKAKEKYSPASAVTGTHKKKVAA
ncbi:acyltransferase family protein [Flammeovirgaceae bacterium 311]|nr:acyltransferase family protein [Flammeovirgaceae bacterium 311]